MPFFHIKSKMWIRFSIDTLNADEEGPDTVLATLHILCGHGVPGELQTFSTNYL